jgi:hypothetical protein
MHREQVMVLHPFSGGMVLPHSSLADLHFWRGNFELRVLHIPVIFVWARPRGTMPQYHKVVNSNLPRVN